MKKRELFFKGKKLFFYIRDEADESVLAEVFKWEEYRSVEDIIKNSKGCILDIGAHIGIFSIYAKAINPEIKIFAFEPEKENFEVLRKNIRANDYENIKTFEYAFFSESKKERMVIEGDSINYHLQRPGETELKTVLVQTINFYDFIESQKISEIELMKLDIEGGEYEIFENLKSSDFIKIKNIILEYHNLKDKNYKIIEKILRENGFSVQIFPSKFEKDLGFMLARNKRKYKKCV